MSEREMLVKSSGSKALRATWACWARTARAYCSDSLAFIVAAGLAKLLSWACLLMDAKLQSRAKGAAP